MVCLIKTNLFCHPLPNELLLRYHEDDDPREVKRSPNEVTNGTSKRSFEFVKGADDTYWGLWVNSPEMWDSLDTPLAEPLPNKVRDTLSSLFVSLLMYWATTVLNGRSWKST